MALPSPVTSENQAAENSRRRRGGMNDVDENDNGVGSSYLLTDRRSYLCVRGLRMYCAWAFAARPPQTKWRGSTPHSSNFQPIHLGGSFTEAPRKPPLRSPRATAPTLHPTFKTDPRAPIPSPSRVCILWFSVLSESLGPPTPGRILVL
ncbi:hypothetical protein AVEN_126199-1 [Araneus ventricosus]|uniref:Uncharacterized protein n=1 Tax=Araneus ventricosus TaxID=182803 RepID=A0A4Y2VSZ3_ARAVE|nr:hypothetical protein AVEN_126199-1 [Araneus ventricosus]